MPRVTLTGSASRSSSHFSQMVDQFIHRSPHDPRGEHSIFGLTRLNRRTDEVGVVESTIRCANNPPLSGGAQVWLPGGCAGKIIVEVNFTVTADDFNEPVTPVECDHLMPVIICFEHDPFAPACLSKVSVEGPLNPHPCAVDRRWPTSVPIVLHRRSRESGHLWRPERHRSRHTRSHRRRSSRGCRRDRGSPFHRQSRNAHPIPAESAHGRQKGGW